MQIIKYFMLFLILVGCSLIGKNIAKKYVMRVKELEEMKNALNIFKNKIQFTYEPIPEIFEGIAEKTNENIGNIFKIAKQKMQTTTASLAWEKTLEESNNNLTSEDKYVLKSLSKLLGQTDAEGQISQINITQKFLETQLKEAQEEKIKNEKLWSKLGTTIGLAIIIVLC